MKTMLIGIIFVLAIFLGIVNGIVVCQYKKIQSLNQFINVHHDVIDNQVEKIDRLVDMLETEMGTELGGLRQ